ncbi:MAG: hypothetical protein NXI18_14160 [Alphaproteobacteria bacterium]|nr:hypothetical protein [Alphaproteobacteria bacterium]
MALTPTGPGNSRVPARTGGRTAVPSRVEAASGSAPARRADPERGYRLKTATTDAEIERQIQRLMTLIANDNIDPDAPPGSYLNLLL